MENCNQKNEGGGMEKGTKMEKEVEKHEKFIKHLM